MTSPAPWPRVDLPLVLDVIRTVAIVLGVVLTLVQLGGYVERRESEARAQLLRAFHTSEFSRARVLMRSLPPRVDAAVYEALAPDERALVTLYMAEWESLGLLVFRPRSRSRPSTSSTAT